MKCRGCGEEFETRADLMKHKPFCTAMNGDAQVSNGTNNTESKEGECIIPLFLCPEEINYLAKDTTVGIRVEGKVTPDGIVVQEVAFIR